MAIAFRQLDWQTVRTYEQRKKEENKQKNGGVTAASAVNSKSLTHKDPISS